MSSPGEIVGRIGKELGLTIVPNYGRECSGVKNMLTRGYSEEEIVQAYMKIKQDKFWQDKYLSCSYVASNIESMNMKVSENEWDSDALKAWAHENN